MITKNYIYNLIYQILTLIIPLVTIPYISRVLGPEALGIYSFSNAYVQYFILFGMIGMGMYAARQIAIIRDDENRINNTFWELNILRFFTVGIALCLYYFTIVFKQDSKIIFGIQGIFILSALIDISWFFTGIEDFKNVVLKNIGIKVSGLILIFILVKDTNDLWKYSLILTVSQLVGQLSMWLQLPKYIKFEGIKLKEIKKHFRGSIILFVPQLAINIYTMLDKIMLGIISNEIEVGIYDNSQRVVKLLATIVTTLAVVTLPRMTNMYQNKNYEEFRRILYKSFSFVSFLAFPLTLGFISVAESFVPWFYGPGFEKIIGLSNFSGWLILTLGWSSIVGSQALISMKREKQFTIAVTGGAVINFILNLVLIPRCDSLGSTIATVIAEYLGMFLMVYFLRDFIKVKELFKGTKNYLFTGILMFIVVKFITNVLGSNIVSTLCGTSMGILIYMGIMYQIKDKNLVFILSFLKKKLLKK